MTGTAATSPPAADDVTVVDVPDRDRYEARAGSELAALADYITTPQLVVFTHTEVRPGFEGRGIASALVRQALDDVRRRGRKVLPVCPFVQAFLARHAEQYADVVYRSTTGHVAD